MVNALKALAFSFVLFTPTLALADTAVYAVDQDGALVVQDATWAGARSQSAGEGTENNTETTFQVSVQQHTPSNTFIISRGFISVFFDLPVGAIVDSVIYEIFVNETTDGDNDARAYISLYESTHAGTGSLVNDDYDQCSDTPWADELDISSITTSSYNTITLNPTAIAALDYNGWNKFCIREGHDAEDVQIDNGTFNRTLNAAIDSGSPSTYSKFTITYHFASSSSSSSSSVGTGAVLSMTHYCNAYEETTGEECTASGCSSITMNVCSEWATSVESAFFAAFMSVDTSDLYYLSGFIFGFLLVLYLLWRLSRGTFKLFFP